MILQNEDKLQQQAQAQANEPQALPAPVQASLEPEVSMKRKEDRRRLRVRRFWVRFFISVVILVLVRVFLMKDLDQDSFPMMVNDPHMRPELGHLDMVLHPEKVEKKFMKVPNNKSALSASRLFDTHPHLAGSIEDFEDAKTVLELFETQFGIPTPDELPIYPAGSPESRAAIANITKGTSHHSRAWIDVYYPVMNTPLNRSLDILDEDGSSIWSADLLEDGNPLDPEAAKYRDAVPTFHGLSYDGEAEGQLVFANYGTKEDYDELVANGVDLKGKVVIVRYGAIFRGLKIKGAQELGAAGVLIYSDPRDDGAVTVENGYRPYPEGPARNPTSVQRGSVQFISVYPGDPSTPGYPAYENATRTEGTNKPSIPSLPISWANAERLLEEISNVTSSKKIKLVNHVDNKVTPIWNSMAVIPGHIKDEVVVIGNHRDAWVMGAADPSSGTVSFHEVVRGFGALLRSGWMPLRTILFANWDAEEYGLVGSTEWGEDFPEFISSKVVAYVNIDVSVSGSRWGVSASPSLAHIIRKTAEDVPHPTIPNKSLWDASEDDGPFEGEIDPDVLLRYQMQDAQKSVETGVEPLGSGSDYTVFLQHLGVASVDQGFGYTLRDAVYHYHSIYDSEHWKEVYGDPDAAKQVAVAKNLGLLTLRLANSIILPLNTTQYSLELESYLDKVEGLPSAQSWNLHFPHLRKSIKKLQHTSLKLDKEKAKAEADIRHWLEHINSNAQDMTTHCFWDNSAWTRIKKVLGFRNPPEASMRCLLSDRPTLDLEVMMLGELGKPYDLGPDVVDEEFADDTDILQGSKAHDLRLHPGGLVRAAKRVRKANQKLIAFERGFISTEGIKDREWYKHLGVAPGKWLGYGATTFPALTEALVVDNDPKRAKLEAKRLQTLIDNLRKELRV